eukprot:TRINITY_DN63096_c0_g1_i1.p1 TRINITY_DN63096_c0_g1~~TRINITY_DN63096_c0_g1_i1.p1  ORF type:complete len:675 (+),score=44.78 TRINITY_DN63096_c0_g1_i1:43-2025(+)
MIEINATPVDLLSSDEEGSGDTLIDRSSSRSRSRSRSPRLREDASPPVCFHFSDPDFIFQYNGGSFDISSSDDDRAGTNARADTHDRILETVSAPEQGRVLQERQPSLLELMTRKRRQALAASTGAQQENQACRNNGSSDAHGHEQPPPRKLAVHPSKELLSLSTTSSETHHVASANMSTCKNSRTAGAQKGSASLQTRRNAAAKVVPTPSFMFSAQCAEDGTSASSSCVPSASCEACQHSTSDDTVDVFKTIAGRPGRGGSETMRITLEELQRAMPVTFVPDMLPTEFADHLLKAFLAETNRWHTSKRWLYEKEIESSRLQSGFRFNRFGETARGRKGTATSWETTGFGDDLRHMRDVVIRTVQRARADLRAHWRQNGEQGSTSSAEVGSMNVDNRTDGHMHASGSGGACSSSSRMCTAPTDGAGAILRFGPIELAQESVILASRGQKLSGESAEWLVRYAQEAARQQGFRWEPNYCVGNFYRDSDDFLGGHSDPVESIGPWATVSSFTLGAARQFRMKPVGLIRTKDSGGGHISSYSIRLPHNSLLIMWEGFQEFWRHEVPKDKGLKTHPIAGPGRLNFTLRRSVGCVLGRRPTCKCGGKARLKPVLKETSRYRGRYFWSCPNPRVRTGQYSTCDFFKWDDELLVEQQNALKQKAKHS